MYGHTWERCTVIHGRPKKRASIDGDARKADRAWKEEMHEKSRRRWDHMAKEPWKQSSVCGTKSMPKRIQQEAKKRKEVKPHQATAPWHLYGDPRKEEMYEKRKQGVGSYMGHLRGGSLHVWGCTERRDARGKGDAVAPELSLWTKSMPTRTEQDAKKRKEVRQSCRLMVMCIVVSHALSMRETLDSIPTWSITKCWEECRRRTEKMRKWAGFSFIHETPKRREPACMFIYGEMHGKYGFSFIHETPKRREPACMFIYEEARGKDEKVGRIQLQRKIWIQLHTWDI